MNIQDVFVLVCVAAAIIFMARKFHGAIKSHKCSCGCEKDCRPEKCHGRDGKKTLAELRAGGK